MKYLISLSQTIEGDYVTCMNCSVLLRIGEEYFATATNLGVAWFSIAPPKLLHTLVGVKADRLAYFSSQLSSHVVNLRLSCRYSNNNYCCRCSRWQCSCCQNHFMFIGHCDTSLEVKVSCMLPVECLLTCVIQGRQNTKIDMQLFVC